MKWTRIYYLPNEVGLPTAKPAATNNKKVTLVRWFIFFFRSLVRLPKTEPMQSSG